MIIKLRKIKELPDAIHGGNIPEGFEQKFSTLKCFFAPPIEGQCFYTCPTWRTSIVREIIDKKTFKTCNSTYEWKIIKDNDDEEV
jgi:hypothetical protein